MSTNDTPWEPPLAGTEVGHLLGALDRLRVTFRWKADGLDAGALNVTIASPALTIGGLLKHLAAVEDFSMTRKLRGEDMGEPWASFGYDGSNDWEFSSADQDSPEELYALYDGAVERTRSRIMDALANGGLDQPAHAASDEGEHASLRRLLFDLVEEYGRHTGHADLIREAIDGRVGEDPPPRWRPVSGQFTFAHN